MPETWMYVMGGLIVALIAFVIAYNLISSLIDHSQKQNALTQFSSLCTDINTVCVQELGNYLERKFSIPFNVRVVYATDDTFNVLPKVFDLIKNKQLSHGKNICLQFKDEQILRCCPEPPKKSNCVISAPYIGILKETEDIWIKVSKILGGPPIREYKACIKKVEIDRVSVSFDVEKCE